MSFKLYNDPTSQGWTAEEVNGTVVASSAYVLPPGGAGKGVKCTTTGSSAYAFIYRNPGITWGGAQNGQYRFISYRVRFNTKSFVVFTTMEQSGSIKVSLYRSGGNIYLSQKWDGTSNSVWGDAVTGRIYEFILGVYSGNPGWVKFWVDRDLKVALPCANSPLVTFTKDTIGPSWGALADWDVDFSNIYVTENSTGELPPIERFTEGGIIYPPCAGGEPLRLAGV